MVFFIATDIAVRWRSIRGWLKHSAHLAAPGTLILCHLSEPMREVSLRSGQLKTHHTWHQLDLLLQHGKRGRRLHVLVHWKRDHLLCLLLGHGRWVAVVHGVWREREGEKQSYGDTRARLDGMHMYREKTIGIDRSVKKKKRFQNLTDWLGHVLGFQTNRCGSWYVPIFWNFL